MIRFELPNSHTVPLINTPPLPTLNTLYPRISNAACNTICRYPNNTRENTTAWRQKQTTDRFRVESAVGLHSLLYDLPAESGLREDLHVRVETLSLDDVICSFCVSRTIYMSQWALHVVQASSRKLPYMLPESIPDPVTISQWRGRLLTTCVLCSQLLP